MCIWKVSLSQLIINEKRKDWKYCSHGITENKENFPKVKRNKNENLSRII